MNPNARVRVGADIPPMLSESKREASHLNLINMGMQALDVNVDSSSSSSYWEDLEIDGFVLGMYTFGKNFSQVGKLLESKDTKEIVAFYYQNFNKSAKYNIWNKTRKQESRKCIQGENLYSGWRLELFLSRLNSNISDGSQKLKLLNVSKSFAKGDTSLENFIIAVKKLVGLRSLIEAVAIGKDKEDLTIITKNSVKAKQEFTTSSASSTCLGSDSSLTSLSVKEETLEQHIETFGSKPQEESGNQMSLKIKIQIKPKIEESGTIKEEFNETNVPRTQSKRKRLLTTRAREALESGESMTCTPKPIKRQRTSTRIKNSRSKVANEQIEESEPTNKEVTVETPKRTPIILKLSLRKI